MYPPPLTTISRSRWSSNNPCSEFGQEGMICLEKVQQLHAFKYTNDFVDASEDQRRKHSSDFLACQYMLDMYRKCMSSEDFEKKKMLDRARTADQTIHTGGFSMFTWR